MVPPVPITVLFIVLYTACSAYSLISKSDVMEILPAIAAVCFALALPQKKASRYRAWSVINATCWMVYDGYTASYVMLIVHLGILISTVTAMVRLDGFLNFKKRG